jgi:hypothetical protein
LQARKARVCLRPQISEHLPMTGFDFDENFTDSRKDSPDNLDHRAPQGVELDPQLLYIPLALFAATVEIAHRPPSYDTSSENC